MCCGGGCEETIAYVVVGTNEAPQVSNVMEVKLNYSCVILEPSVRSI